MKKVFFFFTGYPPKTESLPEKKKRVLMMWPIRDDVEFATRARSFHDFYGKLSFLSSSARRMFVEKKWQNKKKKTFDENQLRFSFCPFFGKSKVRKSPRISTKLISIVSDLLMRGFRALNHTLMGKMKIHAQVSSSTPSPIDKIFSHFFRSSSHFRRMSR